jgi:hypothetical protein
MIMIAIMRSEITREIAEEHAEPGSGALSDGTECWRIEAFGDFTKDWSLPVSG